MSYIGNIIKQHRSNLGLNRKELSESICSDKYVYLIEKGERTPSTDLVRNFSDSLGVDLFDYYQYLDCEDPISVRDYMNLFRMCHRKSDYENLKKVTEEAYKLPDFQNSPWVFQIELNMLCYNVFVENNYKETIDTTNKILQEIDAKYLNSIEAANFYILLSTCYQLTGDLVNANRVLSLAHEISQNKYKIEKYEQIITTVGISRMTAYYLNDELDNAIDEGNKLFKYQSDFNSYERIHYTYFYLSFAYYKKKNFDESFGWFKKGIYSLMHDYKPMDVYYISMQDVFNVIADELLDDKKLISEFKKTYGLT